MDIYDVVRIAACHFCHAAGCPLGNAIPEINAEVLAGRWASALGNPLSPSPLPEFTCRICPALCEEACVQGLNYNIRSLPYG